MSQDERFKPIRITINSEYEGYVNDIIVNGNHLDVVVTKYLDGPVDDIIGYSIKELGKCDTRYQNPSLKTALDWLVSVLTSISVEDHHVICNYNDDKITFDVDEGHFAGEYFEFIA